LTASVGALFGNSSFLSSIFQADINSTQALQSVCRLGSIPFQNFNLDDNNYDFRNLRGLCSDLLGRPAIYSDPYASILLPYYWLTIFAGADSSAKAMSASMFFANEAVLLETAGLIQASRDIYTSPGTRVMKPDISLGGIVAISILIGLQVLALLGLVAYVYHVPSATSSSDAATLVGMGRSLENEEGSNGRTR
jgi:hypothetical protein